MDVQYINILHFLGSTTFAQLLPGDLRAKLNIDPHLLSDEHILESAWGQLTFTLRRGVAEDASVSETQSAQLFLHAMELYVESMLLAAALRDRANLRGAGLTPEHLCGVAGGVLKLGSHDTILGLMLKTGCIGPQLQMDKSKGNDADVDDEGEGGAPTAVLTGAAAPPTAARSWW